jgi:MarR family transcriptional regulator, transcriptional regulator for hemolysin
MPLLEPSDLTHLENAATPAEALNLALLRMTRALLFRTDDKTPLVDLPISQIRCLNAIANDEGRKMQEIAVKLDIKLPAMSQIVERLVQRQLVERRTDPTDRRVARLHLTPDAKQMIEETRALRLAHVEEAISRMEPEMIQRLIADIELLAIAGEEVHYERTEQQGEAAVTETPLEGHDPIVEMLAHRSRAPRRAANKKDDT